MSRSNLFHISYYNASQEIRLSAYADTIVFEQVNGDKIIRAIRIGGYPEVVHALSDALCAGGTFDVEIVDDTYSFKSESKRYERQLTHHYDFHCLTKSRVNHKACPGVMIYEHKLLNTLTDILLENLDVVLGNYALSIEASPEWRASCAELKEKIAAKQRERTRLYELNCGLYEHLTLGVIDKDDYFLLRERYAAQLSQADNEIQTFNEGLARLDEQLKQYQSLKKDARSIRKDKALTAELIDRLIERIEVAPDKHITVRFKFVSEFDRYGEALEQCRAT